MSSSPSPLSPVAFAMSSAPASTAASSPPPSEEGQLNRAHKSTRESSEMVESIEDEEFQERFSRLERLLEKSFTYSKLLGAQMDKEKRACALRAAMQAAAPSKSESSRRRLPRRGKKRVRVEESDEEEAPPVKQEIQEPPTSEGENGQRPKFPQPALVTGTTLKDYQLEGVEWMVSLDKNGVSGILADEMGLGKTLQTIAFNAHLRGLGHYQPFLIVCPLSVLHNWIEEFHKFAPTIPVCMYHGTPAERADLRRTIMRAPDASEEVTIKTQHKRKGKGTKAPARKAPTPKRKINGRLTKRRKIDADDEDNLQADDVDEDTSDVEDDVHIPTTSDTLPPQTLASFPVIVTTYEMILKDRVHLATYNWGYIVVDEGHRLKNLDCKLMQEIKKYPSAGRMILTGTPLHNNLAELWSLLNFILPDIFDDLDTFQEWFNLGTMQSRLSEDQSSQLIGTLHGILKPFLLRRLKADVEGLPPKKEYVLYAPLSMGQRDLYDNILDGSLRNFLLGVSKEVAVEKVAEVDVDAPMQLRKQKKRQYNLDGDDDKYFEMLEDGEVVKAKGPKEDVSELGKQHQQLATRKQINNMKLQNAVMQLRKVCSHPFLFNWPVIPGTQELVLDDQLVNASGKMMILDRLLDELFRRKHKVLLFSQFTTMLDVLEDWATELKGWSICRIDGSTAPLDRREQMNKFQQGGDSHDAPKLFLLSTRAGGLGINLTAADTVIFYDQDWNPQMDIQAQDRAHRIGQTKPVLVFRLVTAHTIETRIMHRATEKRKLEALVIAKGKFKLPGQSGGPPKSNAQSITELTADLLKLEGEQIDVVTNTSAEGKKRVLSDEDLDMLLDRSEAVFTNRKKGWKSEEDGAGKRAAFAVYEAPVHQGNELVAKIMGEDVSE
ncbi:SNF2 family N-terminal domain-containing protein [Suillus clintonianus]|uniref:SNF2 family N-terminal domain-containing protein n=1 Tax=Suillus clintonianus TaxID=1904413 RepID=UPI001B871517|nr:SNF2 family N-terminal domain-containing protein [Suillus clintonianus]KAG2118620.1 SNF2 family N-terminal domain-containing protein [Suillus clintonianus]